MRWAFDGEDVTMLRWLLPILIATTMAGTAFGADLPDGRARPYTKARSATVKPKQDPDSLLSMIPTTPLLAGAQQLPGNYGRAFDYNYQGSYYGGEAFLDTYFFRLPYACGVTGDCCGVLGEVS